MRDWAKEIRRRLGPAQLQGASEADVVEELAQHVEDRYVELQSRGVAESDAREQALNELEDGDVLGERVRRALREPSGEPVPVGVRWGGNFLDGIAADLRLATRLLRRSPGFTTVAALLIALGIGANTTIFSVLNAVLLRPLPGVRVPEQLAAVYTSDYSGPRFGASSFPDLEAMRASGVFTGMAAYTPQSFSVMVGERGVRVLGELVTANYFEILGVRPALGRFFVPTDGAPAGSSPVVVLSQPFWQDRLGAPADVIGSTIRVNGQLLTVIGIAPATFRGSLRGLRMDVWVPPGAPPSLTGDQFGPESRGSRGLLVIGRMRSDATLDGVRGRMDAVAARLSADYPEYWTDVNDRPRVITVLPESEARVLPQVRGAVVGFLALMMSVVGIVLLIACTNVANLMLTRASARRAEMGIRIALGAARGRIVRQMLIESVLLAIIGGTIGVLVATWLTQAVNNISLPVLAPSALDVAMDMRVVTFAALLTMATGILFGTVPALQSSRAPAPMMKDAIASRGPRMRLRNVLVVVQIAASLVLLTGGAAFLRSLVAAQQIDTGIVTRNMILVPFDLASEGQTAEQAQRFYDEVRTRAESLPGVTSVTMAERVPLGAGWSRRWVVVEGYVPGEGEDMEVPYNGVSDGYFAGMGIRMLSGREFTESDRAGAPPVVIVNEAFVRRFWAGRNPLGMRVAMGSGAPFAEVVGVVPDAKYRSLTEEATPYFYYPYAQHPSPSMTLQVRTALDPDAVAPALRAELRALAPALPAPQITTLQQHVTYATLPQRIAMIVLGVLAVIALAIAAIGLYGVVAYGVAQRAREFGIRSALGAAATDLRRMVVGQGLRLTMIGVAVGVVLALGLTWAIRSLLFVSPFDPVALVTGIVVLTAAAIGASYLPARRATRVHPMAALRNDV